MKTVSWILLLVVAVLTLLGGLESANIAYRTDRERVAGVTLTELAAGKPGVENSLRARRGTAASFAAGFATLFLFIVLGPYRRGDRWAWWAILTGTLVVLVLVLLRQPALGVGLRSPGGGTSVEVALLSGVVAIGLALGAGRLRSRA
jgi:cell division protein FtsW (lipid II flippase)